MNKTSRIAATDASWRKIGTLLGAAVLTIALLSGCSDDSSADGNGAETASGQDSGDGKGQESGGGERASGDGLPEDFPDDVPLPGFDSAKRIGGESGPEVASEWWSVLIMLENPTETPVEDYAAQLSDAGYTVTTGSAATEAIGPDWEISFHSSMENTLTVGVMTK